MSAIQREPKSDPLYARPAPTRPFYATGMLLGADDFLAEQTYHRGRLAQALALCSGGGTLAGLRVTHRPESETTAEEIRVTAGVAVDRLGRLIEVARPACLRLARWWESTDADALTQAAYTNFTGFLSARAVAENAALPARAVIADVYLRFIACEQGLTPSFARGPFDALDAVATARLNDAYELLLIPRDGLDNDDPANVHHGLPAPGPDLAAIADPAARRNALHDAVLDTPLLRGGRSGSTDELAPLAEHTRAMDRTAQWLARLLVPVGAGTPIGRVDAPVIVDNAPRRFVPSAQLLQRWLGV